MFLVLEFEFANVNVELQSMHRQLAALCDKKPHTIAQGVVRAREGLSSLAGQSELVVTRRNETGRHSTRHQCL